MEQLTVGELARRGKVNLETIRYYERRGLLPKPPRSASGYRLFSPESVRRIRFIKRAQELGFSLKEIKELLALQVSADGTSADVRERAEAKIADIEERIKTLRSMKKALERLTSACCGQGSVSECPILESLSSERGVRL
jgi:MerR family mercuric resistance operon transcriptional regulator